MQSILSSVHTIKNQYYFIIVRWITNKNGARTERKFIINGGGGANEGVSDN